MKFTIITLFPEVFKPILNTSILKRGVNKNLVEFELINLRDFGVGVHKIVDDKPFGGGVGMVLKADVLAQAVRSIQSSELRSQNKKRTNESRTNKLTILMSASGKKFDQKTAKKLAKLKHITLVCGHYEGVDQRFIDKYVDIEISIGDYVLTGGEIPAMVIVDSITRLIPGVLEKKEAILNESFSSDSSLITHYSSLLLEHPQYTRPDNFDNLAVPKVLLSGNHQEIDKWRKEQAIKKTKKIRPDLLKRV